MLPIPDYQSIEFASDGVTLRGRRCMPSGHPCGVVVMAHGLSATIPMTMDKYAERFAERGRPRWHSTTGAMA